MGRKISKETSVDVAPQFHFGSSLIKVFLSGNHLIAQYAFLCMVERALFTRERNDGLYRVVTYLCAKMLEELLLAAGASALFAVVVWFMVGLQGSFAIFWLTYYLVLSIGIGMNCAALHFYFSI